MEEKQNCKKRAELQRKRQGTGSHYFTSEFVDFRMQIRRQLRHPLLAPGSWPQPLPPCRAFVRTHPLSLERCPFPVHLLKQG